MRRLARGLALAFAFALTLGLAGAADEASASPSGRLKPRRVAARRIKLAPAPSAGRLVQPVPTLGRLYALSAKSLPEYDRIMGAYAANHGARFRPAPLKQRARAREKIAGQLDGDARRLTDVVRGTLEFSDLRGLYRTLAELKEREQVVQIKDYVQNPGLGFPHVNVRFKLESGLIVETQLTIQPFFDAYHGGGEIHRLYEQYRTLKESRRPLTAREAKRLGALPDRMRRRFAKIEPRYEPELERLKSEPWFTDQFGALADGDGPVDRAAR